MNQTAVLKMLFEKAEQDNSFLWDCPVNRLELNETAGEIQVELNASTLFAEEEIVQVSERIRKAYPVPPVALQVNYKLNIIDERALAFLKEGYIKQFPSLEACFEQVCMECEGETLRMQIPDAMQLRLLHLKDELEQLTVSLIGRKLQIETISLDDDLDYEALRREKFEQLKEELAREEPVKEKVKQAQFIPGKKDDLDESVIYGKPVARNILPIGEISMDSAKVSVQGNIFFSEWRRINGKDKFAMTIDVTDGTGSIRVTRLIPEEQVKDIKDRLCVGRQVLVQGTVSFSPFERDLIITPSAILEATAAQKKDTAEKKRVELHLHTTMSSMDGMCEVKKALQFAASMGHTAMAVTDHGVVQAFPEAMKAAKELKKAGTPIKVIYGLEGYCVNDLRGGVVKGYSNIPLDGEIVVFDLETTGLRPLSCEIIEIAAVRVSGGQALGSFHTYVKPSVSIPLEITELTGINDDTVKDAISIDQALPQFFEFCGGKPLCAHNADFDIGFLKAACEKLGIEREFCSIDTVELSRVLLPELKKHRLNDLASYFGFNFQHHRADEDTMVLARIFLRLIEMLKEKIQIQRVDQINQAVDSIKEKGAPSGKTYHIIILVKNQQGLRALYEQVSLSHLEYFKRYPIIPLSLLNKHRENLIVGSACEAGELFRAIVDGKPWKELCAIAQFYDFLEIQPLGNNRFMLACGEAKDEEQLKSFNRTVMRLGDTLNKPVCATGDVHFLQPEDSIYREILMTGKGFADASAQAPLYYRTTEEMLSEFSYLGKERAMQVVVEAPNQISGMCSEVQPVPDGTCPPSIENSAQELERIARNRAQELYSENGVLHPVVSARLEAELVPIIENGFDVMYITAQKLVSKSLAAGYLVGSRGSVGSSFVAYLTGITEVNALDPHYRCPNCHHTIFEESGKYGTGVDMPDRDCPKCGTRMIKDGFSIPFATFLGFHGEKAPDIDLNFSGEYQSTAHKEAARLFGEQNVFKAGTIGTVKERTAFGYVKKYLEEKGKELGRAEENRLVQGCTGVKRTTGQHPGGLIILPKGRSIYEFCPVQHPADDPDSDIITTHFDYHSLNDTLLKLDLLGHDDPTMVRRLEDLTRITAREIPLDDPDTMRIYTDISPLGIETDEILEETGAAAVPEFGTKFVRGMLMETRPDSFDGLVRIAGLSHGTNVWRNNAQDLIGKNNITLHDLICCRDDITNQLIHWGLEPKDAFTISEGVRKGKGLKPEWKELMVSHGVPDWYIGSCEKIEYLFPRAHAVAYVQMGFRIAWFKVHQPLAFYSAYFSTRAVGFDASYMIQGDNSVRSKYSQLKNNPKRTTLDDDVMVTLEVCHEFYKRGFSFAPVDVYQSDTLGFRIEGKKLVPPLTSLPGVGEAAAQSIVNERQKGPFLSSEDIMMRCDKVSSKVIETLEQAGALNQIPKTNQLDLFEAMGL